MKIITKQEVEDFILAQKPDKSINFEQNLRKEDCGCLMVHLGNHFKLNFSWAATTSWFHFSGQQVGRIEDIKFDHWGVHHITYDTLQEAVLKERTRTNGK